MVRVFRDSGFAVEVRSVPGELRVQMPAALGDDARARFEDRERIAAAAAAVARAPARVGRRDRRLAQAAARSGPRCSATCARRAIAVGCPSCTRGAGRSAACPRTARSPTCPEPVELAVVAVPADGGRRTSRASAAPPACGRSSSLSAGFAEVGAAGAARQAELLDVCRAAGMRLVGPNCLGVLNTAADVGLNATFAPVAPTPGRVAFASQSGAFGIAAIAEAARRGLGLSSFVSTGNKADLSGNDLLQYWEDDAGTDVIGLYLESFGNPRALRPHRPPRRRARSR